MSRNQNASTSTDANYPRTSSGLMSSHQSSRTSSPPGLTAIQTLAPMTSISDASEYVSITLKCEENSFTRPPMTNTYFKPLLQRNWPWYFLFHILYTTKNNNWQIVLGTSKKNLIQSNLSLTPILIPTSIPHIYQCKTLTCAVSISIRIDPCLAPQNYGKTILLILIISKTNWKCNQ